MRRVCYSVAMSLDGYIAGPQGESDWIVMDPDIDFNAIFDAFDTILLGRKTYETTGAGGGMPGIQSYVFSRTLRPEDCPGVTVSDNPKKTIQDLKSREGKDIWLFGGGSLFRSLLELAGGFRGSRHYPGAPRRRCVPSASTITTGEGKAHPSSDL